MIDVCLVPSDEFCLRPVVVLCECGHEFAGVVHRNAADTGYQPQEPCPKCGERQDYCGVRLPESDAS